MARPRTEVRKVRADSRAVVCHATTVHAPFDPRIFHKECRSLAGAGYEVHLIACHDRDETVRGVHLHGLPRPPSRLIRMLLWPWLVLRRIGRLPCRPRIVHLHDPELLPMGFFLRLGGARVVYDVHENVADHLLHKPYLPRPLRRPISWTYRVLERLLLGGMATIHVLQSVADTYPPPRASVRNLPRVSVDGTAISRGHQPPRVVYVGDINRERGAMVMIEVARLLSERVVDFEMRLIGPVREAGLEDAMRRTIHSAGLDERVTLAGPVPYERVPAELADADIGLCLLLPLPNYLNSLPTKAVEYMAAGLPVVASNLPCWRDLIVGTGAGVQVDPADPVAAADVLHRWLQDPALRREMGRRGRRAVERELNWDAEQETLLAFYRRLLGGEAAP